MDRAACAHVRARFSRQVFGKKLERLLEEELASGDGGQRG
jgi:hypothetical protein